MVLMAPPRHARVRQTRTQSARHVEVRPLEWDTAFFGERMATLVLVDALAGGAAHPASGRARSSLLADSDALAHELRAALRQAELDGYRHVSFRVPAADIPAIWAAERAGLRLMDVALDLRFTFGATPLPSPGDRAIRLGVSADIPALRAMTTGAFTLTRFGLDPFFTNSQVDAFYEAWATNLFSGLADVVLVADVDSRPAGFVSCKVTASGEGRIPLVATSQAFQRRGIARDLIAAALAWFADAGCSVAYVRTQAANNPAVTLYERAGFTVNKSELTFTTTLAQETAHHGYA
jgi:GNAT superfamily N-acetyltransferase